VLKSVDGGTSWVAINNNLYFLGLVTNVNDIAIDPVTPENLLLGTEVGVFRSTNGGSRWTNVTSAMGFFVPHFLQLAADPAAPKTIYGVGYSDLAPHVFKSLDGGLTWTTLEASFPGLEATCIAVDSSVNPSAVYISAFDFFSSSTRVYKSLDGGIHWIEVSSGLAGGYIRFIKADPNQRGTVWVATTRTHGSGGLFQTRDGGVTWTSASNGLPDLSPQSLAVTPAGIFLATNHGIFKSVDGGQNWSASAVGMGNEDVQFVTFHSSGILFAATRRDGVFKSIDQGGTWTSSNSGVNAREVNALAVSPTGTVLAAASLDGVFRSMQGNGWSRISGAPASSMPALMVDPVDPATFYLGASGSDAFYISKDSGTTWKASSTGMENNTVTCLAFDSRSPDTLYAGTLTIIYKSVNRGASWSPSSNGLPTNDFEGLYAVAVDPVNPNIVYGGMSSGVYKTTNGGQTWVLKNVGSVGSNVTLIHDIAIDPTAPNNIYLATQRGTYRSSDGGEHWQATGSLISLSNTFPVSATSILVDPTNTSTLYVGTNDGGVFRSTNGAVSWDLINNGFGAAVNKLSLDPSDHSTLYAATGAGVFVYSSGNSGGATRINLSLAGGGAGVNATRGSQSSVRAGFALLDVNSGTAPYGTAVFSISRNGLPVTEAGVPASPPMRSALLFIDYRKNLARKTSVRDAGVVNINTGIAAVNPNPSAAHLALNLRDPQGNILSRGTVTLGANSHMAKFIDQLGPEFILPSDFESGTGYGSLEVQTDQVVSLLALRLTTNQRGDTLLTTVPLLDLAAPMPAALLSFPQVADGGGYQTTLLLLNPTSTPGHGIIKLFDDAGNPFPLRITGMGDAQSTFAYDVPGNGVLLLTTDGSQSPVKAGSVQVIPSPGTGVLGGAGILSLSVNGVLASESGIPAAALTNHARIYVDRSISPATGFLARNTGLALADTSGNERIVSFAAYLADGTTLVGSGSASLPGNGHVAKYAEQIVSSIGTPFSGVLDISSSVPFAALTLRTSLSANYDVLMTTFPIADMTRPAPVPVIFPQIADGGGYQTQFIFLNPSGSGSTATLSYWDDSGAPLPAGKHPER
jgi:hypothetical protein